MTAREWWKINHRAMRIARRETLKATQDMLVYGTGIVYVGEDAKPHGVAEHIPIERYGRSPILEALPGRAALMKLHTARWQRIANRLKP